MKIYLAGRSYRKHDLNALAVELQNHDYEITSNWLVKNFNEPWLNAEMDLQDIDRCDLLILHTEIYVADDGQNREKGGRHVEFGYALAKGKTIILYPGNPENVFHYVSGRFVYVSGTTIESLIKLVKTIEINMFPEKFNGIT